MGIGTRSLPFICGFSVRIALFFIAQEFPFSLSLRLSLPTPTPSLSSPLSRRLACVAALRFDGRNPEERREPEKGEYERTDRSVTHFYLHPPNHLVAPDFNIVGKWGVSIHWRAAEFINEGCGQVCWKNSHSFRSVR